MTRKHTVRRDTISGSSSLRDKIRQVASHRTHDNFSKFLSSGPYSGVEILLPGQNHCDNGDEELYSSFYGSFSKGLKHDPENGTVDISEYAAFKTVLDEQARNGLTALPVRGSLAAIDSLPNRSGASARGRSYVNPLSGLCAGVYGLDPYDISIPPAPSLSSEVAAKEMVELYWMAVVRDVHFTDWGENRDIATAMTELDALNKTGIPFTEHWLNNSWSKNVDLSTVFRGSAPGNNAGGYVSQFLIHDIPYGNLTIQQRQRPMPTTNYMKTWSDWLDVQNGRGRNFGSSANPRFEPRRDEVEGSSYRYIHTLRDLAHYVHFDALHEAYFNAALIMDSLSVPFSPVNPYVDKDRRTSQRGFGTFGGPHVLSFLTEVSTRALKAVWHQKWFVHRRLRPEGFGGRVHIHKVNGGGPYNLHPSVLDSEAVARVKERDNTWLLPQAFPEGSPMHPSYGAGHATVAGACITILKAMYDPRHTFRPGEIMKVRADGKGIEHDRNPPTNLSIGGELNKLAANIAIGRNAAGVHYRSDYTKSLALGEAVAMAMLQEQALTFSEDGVGPVWLFENFGGKVIAIDSAGTISNSAYPSPPAARVPNRSQFSS